MKLKITAELSGQELIDNFVNQLKSNKIDPNLTGFKFFVLNKAGEEISMAVDKIKLVYNQE